MAGNGIVTTPAQPAGGILPGLGAMAAAMMGEAADARQEAENAAEWRRAMLAHAERQSAALEAVGASLARLEESLGTFTGGGMGALFGRRPGPPK